MADCSGEQCTAGEGEPVVKSAKQLKKDAKKKEKMEKFQQKQAKMAGQKGNNSGAEVRERERGGCTHSLCVFVSPSAFLDELIRF